MAHLFWTLEDGLHEASADELRIEASHLVNRASRARWGRKKNLMDRAAHMFADADTADDGEDKELRAQVKEHIAAEPDRAYQMQRQARDRWGYEWEKMDD